MTRELEIKLRAQREHLQVNWIYWKINEIFIVNKREATFLHWQLFGIFLQSQMKEKEDKLRLVTKILVDDNGLGSARSDQKDTIPVLPNAAGDVLSIKTPGGRDVRSRRV